MGLLTAVGRGVLEGEDVGGGWGVFLLEEGDNCDTFFWTRCAFLAFDTISLAFLFNNSGGLFCFFSLLSVVSRLKTFWIAFVIDWSSLDTFLPLFLRSKAGLVFKTSSISTDTVSRLFASEVSSTLALSSLLFSSVLVEESLGADFFFFFVVL